MRLLRIGAFVLAVPVILVLFAALISVVLSPSGAGEPVVEALGIPYRAVIAHRGASHIAPEGTLPAYLAAQTLDVDYLEADLRRTADGVLVVFHDDTPARTTNVADVFPGREHDLLETFTYDELMRLDAGSWFNEEYPERARPAFVGLRILTLAELLDVAADGNAGLYLETKGMGDVTGFEAQLVESLVEAGWLRAANRAEAEGEALSGEPDTALAAPIADAPGRVVFQSFHPQSIAALKRLAPDVPRVQLISTELEAEQGWENLLATATDDAHGIGPVGFLAWPWNTGAAHREKLIVHSYVINEEWQMRLLTFFGVDGLFTDRPELLLQVYGRTGAIDTEALLERIGY